MGRGNVATALVVGSTVDGGFLGYGSAESTGSLGSLGSTGSTGSAVSAVMGVLETRWERASSRKELARLVGFGHTFKQTTKQATSERDEGSTRYTNQNILYIRL